MGRAPAFWSEENVKLIKDHFIAVAVPSSDHGRNDAVGQFCRDSGLHLNKWEGVQCCLTAGGKILDMSYLAPDLKKTLEKWHALPEAERTPGAVKVPPRGAADAQGGQPIPPAGGLILKVHSRAFMHAGERKLRYVTGQDLWYDQEGKKTLAATDQKGGIASPQAQPDHLWLTEAEWKSLLPTNPRKDDKIPMPPAIAERIVRIHLNPLRFFGRYGSDTLDRNEIRGSELILQVDAVSPKVVRLRLDGFAKFGKVPPTGGDKGTLAILDSWGYEPRVLGYLEYDPQKQVFTRFDIVALGEHFGRLGLGAGAPARNGLQPLGIAFALVKGDRPADRVPPGRYTNSRSYFDLNK